MEKKDVIFSSPAGLTAEYHIQVVERAAQYKVFIYPSRDGVPVKGRTLKQYMWVGEDKLIRTMILAVMWCNKKKRKHDTGFDKRWAD